MSATNDAFELCSEFAAVRVSRDDRGNGPRLRIEDLRTGRVRFFDPLELEWLSWIDRTADINWMPSSTYGRDARLGRTP